ncbi:MAG TPA: DinB family protein [Hanamia sp.]|nr:DinB family protein [Hanamia sp.]
MKEEKTNNENLTLNLINLLDKENSHISLQKALKDIPFDLLGKKPNSLPYSIWQLAEHIRISQFDILEFSRNPKYKSPSWPEGYWPSATKPESEDAWEACVQQIKKDRTSFIELLKNNSDNLYEPFKYGDGQTLLREALVLADHNSYHTG